MALTKERKTEIGLILLKKLLEKEGIQLKPSEVKRSVVNMAKKLQISEVEVAQFQLEIVTEFYDATKEKLLRIATEDQM